MLNQDNDVPTVVREWFGGLKREVIGTAQTLTDGKRRFEIMGVSATTDNEQDDESALVHALLHRFIFDNDQRAIQTATTDYSSFVNFARLFIVRMARLFGVSRFEKKRTRFRQLSRLCGG